ncbi:sodium/proline symporter [Paenactinomyces guangxiensis]|uniref:Sodium/proline symporter n=1 Tax=Paenactinomyces guangxiensis TaxID=1490290 RepID=A0A7W1WRZ1_9BACL|nr:sodium/proline symporter [Paenactinomyces guangxiensis]MBA4494979.1 sodium/proline symporter [Paenactinomyces guangxiensis]MBH8592062.1 sodium/proline symporter [Paenactinomyces guangxiensis]
MDSAIIYSIIILYFLSMLGVGFYFTRKDLDHSDYFLGGNKLPGWALAFSERATGESAYMFLGAVGFIYITGLSGIWILVGMFFGVIFSWLFLAKQFMNERKKYNVYTLTDYIAVKFPAHNFIIRWISSLIIGTFFIFYISAQFAGAGKSLYSISGFNITWGTIIIAVIVIAYSCMGGFMSVVWTDVVQSFLMMATFIVVPIVAFTKIDSEKISIFESLAQVGNHADSWTGGLSGVGLGFLLFANFAWFFGWLGGQPQLSSRFMALKDEKELNSAKIVAIGWTLIVYMGAFLVGIFGMVLYPQGTLNDYEMILPHMMSDLLPTWLVGVFISAILAAIMSTASSQLMVITTSVSEDIIHKSLGIKLTSKGLVKISRISVIAGGLLGLILALTSDSLIYTLVSFAWAGIGNTFSAAVILIFFWKKTSGAGVIATIVTGFISAIVWNITPLETFITSRASTFFIAIIAGIIFSLLKPDKEIHLRKDQPSEHPAVQ